MEDTSRRWENEVRALSSTILPIEARWASHGSLKSSFSSHLVSFHVPGATLCLCLRGMQRLAVASSQESSLPFVVSPT